MASLANRIFSVLLSSDACVNVFMAHNDWWIRQALNELFNI